MALTERFSFRSRMLAGILSLALLLTGAGGIFYYFSTRALVVSQLGARLKDIGRTAAYLFSPEDRRAMRSLREELDRLSLPVSAEQLAISDEETFSTLPDEDSTRLMQDAGYLKLVQKLRQIKEASRDSVFPWRFIPQRLEKDSAPLIHFAYLMVPVKESVDGRIIKSLADSDIENIDQNNNGKIDSEEEGTSPGTAWPVPAEPFRRAFQGQAASSPGWYSDKWGTWISAAIPILDDSGQVVAVLGLDYNMKQEASLLERVLGIAIALVFVGTLLSVILSIMLSRLLSRSVRSLAGAVEQFTGKNFDARVPVTSNDEIGRLGTAFNRMVDEIRAYSDGLTATLTAIERFVPREFLQQMGHETVITVSLGDQVSRQMTVFFCDIRAFTTLSESMTPRETFAFINDYLSRVSPIIRENHGFIDKYIGDAIMALFPGDPLDAVKAAIQIMLELALLNNDRSQQGLPEVRIGIGIHHGETMLGTVGEEQRMDGTVISDAVNVAARLENLTKKFGASILVSEETLRLAEKKAGHGFASRTLGSLRLRGKKQSMAVVEILDGLGKAEMQERLDSAPMILRATRLMQQRQYPEARSLLKEAARLYPLDRSPRLLLVRLKKLMAA
ncbi:MAG: HAMP domain-containing protein [Spirochaetales bacterium]|nr:HAMP domain-containing protein [Spirochaetales bacterium]